MAAKLIGDGYTRDGYIAEDTPDKEFPDREILHGAVSFRYRPATRGELIDHESAVEVLNSAKGDAKKRKAAETLTCQFVIDRLVNWDVETSEGGIAPINVDSMMRIHPLVFSALYAIVRGWRGSDARPGAAAGDDKTEEEHEGN